jgi:hypothetical protein
LFNIFKILMSNGKFNNIFRVIDRNKRLVLVDSMDWLKESHFPFMINYQNTFVNNVNERVRFMVDVQKIQRMCDKLPDNTLIFIEIIRMEEDECCMYFHHGKIRGATHFLLNREIN